MEVIQDPETFQTSDIVEKSSKSGVFSNQRLLVIRNGFLYYFSTVPKSYKKHLPNLLDTLQQLPKSSIEIKHIHTIKLQSASSPNIIIKFYEKNMINRQEIRQSINSQKFNRVEKQSEELEEWKFTYSNLLQCRLWYAALVKLKQYFVKQDDKIQQFFEDFDPKKRQTKLEMRKTLVNLSKSSTQKNPQNRSSLNIKIQPNPPPIQHQPPPQNKIDKQLVKPQEIVKQTFQLKSIDEAEQINAKNIQQEIRIQIEQQIRQQQRQKVFKDLQNMKSILSQKQAQINELSLKLKQEQQSKINFHLTQQFSIQTDQELIVSTLFNTHNLQSSKELTKQYQNIIQQQQQDLDKNYFFANSQKNIKIQYQPQQILKITPQSQFNQPIKLSQQSVISFREDYDFYQEQGAIYVKQQKFNDLIAKETEYIKYTQHMNKKAINHFVKYINEDKPQNSVIIERDHFLIQIVCSPGKIVNLNGVDKLVYSNKDHQRLKRQFKLYNHLHNACIKWFKKKSNFQVRIPLCFHVEYKGYSGLIKMLPYLQDGQNDQAQFFLKNVVGEQKRSHFKIKQIKNRQKKIYLILVAEPFKITQNQKSIIYNGTGLNFIHECRIEEISINSQRITAQIQKLKFSNSVRSYRNWQYVKFCRQIKKIYRTCQPFSELQTCFLKTFLQSSEYYLSLVSQSAKIQKRGSLISYLEYFFGFQIQGSFTNIFEQYQKVSVIDNPVVRSYDNKFFTIVQISNNFQKYIKQQKLDLAKNSLSLLKEISLDKVNNQLFQIKYDVKMKAYSQAIQKLILLKKKISKHDLRFMEISALLIQSYRITNKNQQMLLQLTETFQWVNYMLGKDDQYKGYLYLLTAQILIKEHKINEGINIYRLLLEDYINSISKQQIFISFSNVLLLQHNADPNYLIQFIKIFLKTQFNQLGEQLIKIQKKSQLKVIKHLGYLYKINGNIDKAVKYYQIAFNFHLAYLQVGSNISNSEQTNQFISNGIQLLQCYNNSQAKLDLLRKIFKIINKLSLVINIFSQSYYKLLRQLSTKLFIEQIQLMKTKFINVKQIFKNQWKKLRYNQERYEQLSKLKSFITINQQQLEIMLEYLINRRQISKKLKQFIYLYINTDDIETYLCQ